MRSQKIPAKEHAYIWLYRFARGEYSEQVYNDAYHFLTINAKDGKGNPHFIAMIALYISCVHNNTEIDIGKCSRILGAYHHGTKKVPSILGQSKLISMLKKRSKSWKLKL